MDLDLKNTRNNSLDSDWFRYNQAGMLLEKYENLLELSVKKLVMQSNLASFSSLGQTMFGVCKTNVNVFVVKFRYFSYLARVIRV